MNLIYFDESGNTGLNLKDTQQPVFVLAAMIVPESKWYLLENSFFDVLHNYFGQSLPEPFEIHAMKLKSGHGIFRSLTLQQQLSFRDEMLKLLVDNEIVIIYRRIIKSKFEIFCEKYYGPGIKVSPYIMALPFVCVEVDHCLQQKGKDELGLLIFDEQKENWDDAERSLRTLRLDESSLLKTSRIIEKGFAVDSSKSFGLQLVDLSVYYIRKYEENKLGLKKVSEFDKQTFINIDRLILTGQGSKTEDILQWVREKWVK